MRHNAIWRPKTTVHLIKFQMNVNSLTWGTLAQVDGRADINEHFTVKHREEPDHLNIGCHGNCFKAGIFCFKTYTLNHKREI